jgi:hypothetical protein
MEGPDRQEYPMKTRALAAVVLVIVLGVQLPAQMPEGKSSGLSAAERTLVGHIALGSIRKFTAALSSDEMGGRGTGAPGGEKAAQWLAAQFRRFGMKPLGDGPSYLQPVPFVESATVDTSSFKVDGTALTLGSEWAPLSVPGDRLALTAGLVFVGYGVVDEALHRNDLAGASVEGKIAVIFLDRPANVSVGEWGGLANQRLETIRRAGARGFVYIENGRGAVPVRLLVDYLSRPQFAAPGIAPAPPSTPLPVFGINDASAAMLFAGSGVAPKIAFALAERDDFRAIDLKPTVDITVERRQTPVTAYNVVGYLEGSDPVLKAEAIVFTAHYDAYGTIRGRIYNGAADNAIGTAEMLAAAEAFSKMRPRPRRSLIFLATTAEEHGLAGSRYWASHPTWNIEKISADLNLDGIGTEIFGPVKQVIGFGAEHSSIGTMLDEVLKAYGITLMADPIPEEGVFTRSDHYAFVERGVPALMLVGAQAGTRALFVKQFKDWEAVYYHQPSDDVYPAWHWPGAKTVADMMSILGWRLAQQDGMPSWAASSPYHALTRGNTGAMPTK